MGKSRKSRRITVTDEVVAAMPIEESGRLEIQMPGIRIKKQQRQYFCVQLTISIQHYIINI